MSRIIVVFAIIVVSAGSVFGQQPATNDRPYMTRRSAQPAAQQSSGTVETRTLQFFLDNELLRYPQETQEFLAEQTEQGLFDIETASYTAAVGHTDRQLYVTCQTRFESGGQYRDARAEAINAGVDEANRRSNWFGRFGGNRARVDVYISYTDFSVGCETRFMRGYTSSEEYRYRRQPDYGMVARGESGGQYRLFREPRQYSPDRFTLVRIEESGAKVPIIGVIRSQDDAVKLASWDQIIQAVNKSVPYVAPFGGGR